MLEAEEKVQSIPFPAVTVMESFAREEIFAMAPFNYDNKTEFHNLLAENNLVNLFFAQVLVCHSTPNYAKYPFKDYENQIVSELKKISDGSNFAHEGIWNSRFKVPFVQRLTERGMAYSYNVLPAEEVFHLDQ